MRHVFRDPRSFAPQRTGARLLIAALLACAATTAHTQCSLTGNWQGTWNGKDSKGAQVQGTLAANFNQTGENFTGTFKIGNRTFTGISGTQTGASNVVFTFNNSSGNEIAVVATGQFSSNCQMVSGNFTIENTVTGASNSGNYKATDTVTVTVLDPIPGLAANFGSEFSLDNDPTLLSENGTPVVAVAADGVAEVVVMISNLPQPSQQVTLSLVVAGTAIDGSTGTADTSGLDGQLQTILQTDTPQTGAYQVTLSAVPVGNQNVAFAVYVPPVDFVRPGGTTGQAPDVSVSFRPVDLEVQDTSGNELTLLQFNLARPPVLLVQGIWEDQTVFSDAMYVAAHFGNSGIQQLFTCPDNYNSNTSAIGDASASLLQAASECMDDFKTQNPNTPSGGASHPRIAAGQVDVIAHGSAGLAALEASYPEGDYQTTETYGQGYYHKLITLETPYFGSFFAQQYSQPTTSASCQKALANAGRPNSPALLDMTPQAEVVTEFESGLPHYFPKHAIAAELDNVAYDSNVNDAFNGTFIDTTAIDNMVNAAAPVSGCLNVFSTAVTSPPTFNLNVYFSGQLNPTATMFNGANDTMSTVGSQFGLLNVNGGLVGNWDILQGSSAYLPFNWSLWAGIPAILLQQPVVPSALELDDGSQAGVDFQTWLDDQVGQAQWVH
jgi:hypothetical protein